MNVRASAFWARLRAHRLASTLLILLTLAVGILIGTVISYGVKGKEAREADAAQLAIPSPQQLSTAFSVVAKQLEPAVVNINTDTIVRSPRRRRSPHPQVPGYPGDEDSPFQDFFDRLFPQGPGGGDATPQRAQALGSGVIVDSKGYIITNRHVIDQADRIWVKLMDDPKGFQGHRATVVGSDQETDIAVIKIDAGKPLPSAKIGNSDGLQVGEWLIAIGSPFGLQQSVTAGIVSAVGRGDLPGGTPEFQKFIQTDAAINPGNSGGPLVNMKGEVVGINTAIFTEGGGYQGVGFAMPSNTVAQVYNQLIGPEHRVVRGSIGIAFGTAPDPAISRVYGTGVVVQDVTPNGPADKAGLKTGDVITAIEGKPLKTGDDLLADVAARKPGSKATITYMRDGKQNTASLAIGDRSKVYADRFGEPEEAADAQPTPSRLGVTVRGLTPDVADRIGIEAGKGVVVQEVKPGSFADDVNLQRGMVILEVNKQPVNSEEDFRRVTGSLKGGQDVVFLVRVGTRQNSRTVFLAGTLPTTATEAPSPGGNKQ